MTQDPKDNIHPENDMRSMQDSKGFEDFEIDYLKYAATICAISLGVFVIAALLVVG